MPRYRVRIAKNEMVFSAGHFITFAQDVCERLHGHNYRVAAEVEGALDENHYVVDFVLLRDTLAALVAELDHFMLLPTLHPRIQLTAGSEEVEARFEGRRWVFPRCDCVLLPLANTTAELLARHLAVRLREILVARGGRPERVAVEVEESFGQSAICELNAEDAPRQ